MFTLSSFLFSTTRKLFYRQCDNLCQRPAKKKTNSFSPFEQSETGKKNLTHEFDYRFSISCCRETLTHSGVNKVNKLNWRPTYTSSWRYPTFIVAPDKSASNTKLRWWLVALTYGWCVNRFQYSFYKNVFRTKVLPI